MKESNLMEVNRIRDEKNIYGKKYIFISKGRRKRNQKDFESKISKVIQK